MAEARADQSGEIGSILAHQRLAGWKDTGMNEFLEPGALVRLAARPDWGLGQVQSVIGHRITVNFEHAGKVVIDGSRVLLEPDYSRPPE